MGRHGRRLSVAHQGERCLPQIFQNKKNIYICTGNTETPEDFIGRDNSHKKVWLFLSKIPDRVDERMVGNYIINDVVEKHLDTRIGKTKPNNKCFHVGIKYDLKDVVYEPTFWPKNVAYQRFRFKRQYEEQNTNEETQKENQNNNTFLGG